MSMGTAPTVLVFAGLDPSGGAGLAADVLAIAAQGAHALPVATALTVQDNEHVHAVQAIDAAFVLAQAQALADTATIRAVKIGIPGSRANARAIAGLLRALRERDPQLPIVLDPVLASGHGDALAEDDPVDTVGELLPLATIVLPNEPEACAIAGFPCAIAGFPCAIAGFPCAIGDFPCAHVLLTGGHGEGNVVENRWYTHGQLVRRWRWARLPGAFHGSGCTLAAALAGRLAHGETMAAALGAAQAYCHDTLARAFAIAPGQRIPRRFLLPIV